MRRRAVAVPAWHWETLHLAQRLSLVFGWSPDAPPAIAQAWRDYSTLLTCYRAVRHELPPDAPARKGTAFVVQLEAAVRRLPRRDIEAIGDHLWRTKFPHG